MILSFVIIQVPSPCSFVPLLISAMALIKPLSGSRLDGCHHLDSFSHRNHPQFPIVHPYIVNRQVQLGQLSFATTQLW